MLQYLKHKLKLLNKYKKNKKYKNLNKILTQQQINKLMIIKIIILVITKI